MQNLTFKIIFLSYNKKGRIKAGKQKTAERTVAGPRCRTGS